MRRFALFKQQLSIFSQEIPPLRCIVCSKHCKNFEQVTTCTTKVKTSCTPCSVHRITAREQPVCVAGLNSLWVSSSGWADVRLTNLTANTTLALVSSRTSCPGLFCAPDQRGSGSSGVVSGGRFLLEVVHQHRQGPSHFQLAAVGAEQAG